MSAALRAGLGLSVPWGAVSQTFLPQSPRSQEERGSEAAAEEGDSLLQAPAETRSCWLPAARHLPPRGTGRGRRAPGEARGKGTLRTHFHFQEAAYEREYQTLKTYLSSYNCLNIGQTGKPS